MSAENLTTEERRNLDDGAVIEWQRADGSWQIGTVDCFDGFGRVALYDGSLVLPKTTMRLVSALPAIPTDCDVRGINNDGVRFPPQPAAKPAELPSDLAIDEAADAEDAKDPVCRCGHLLSQHGPIDGSFLYCWATDACGCTQFVRADSTTPEAPQPPKRSRRGDNKRQDAALWLRAVTAVQEAMYNGMDRASAVRCIAELPEFASIRLNVAMFCWWRSRFVKAGQMPRPRKTMPKLASRPKDDAAELAIRRVGAAMEETIKALQAELAAEREAKAKALAELATEREALKSAVDNLTLDQAERDAAVRRADAAEAELAALKAELATEREALRLARTDRAALSKTAQVLQEEVNSERSRRADAEARFIQAVEKLKEERTGRAVAPSSARVSVTFEAPPSWTAAILAAIGGR